MSLTFPRLIGCSGTCYKSENDTPELSVESVRIDDGDEYELSGDTLTLGAGGISASPASGSSEPAGDVLALPIQLAADQTWSIAERSGKPLGENGMYVSRGVTGSSDSLTVDMSDRPILYVTRSIDVGPLSLSGTDWTEGAVGGLVMLIGADLNATDDNPVGLSHIELVGTGTVGPLTTSDAELHVGTGAYPAGDIEASSATFDAASEVMFLFTGAGTSAGMDYSQLTSEGPVALGDSKLEVYVSPPASKNPCPTLTLGQTYILISTNGTLSGSFGNAPEDGEIPIHFDKSCADVSLLDLRIEYHRSASVQTVTGTVVAPVQSAQPAGERTYIAPGAIAPQPVNLQIEREFWEHPPWANTPASKPASTLQAAPKVSSRSGTAFLLGAGQVTISRKRSLYVKIRCTGESRCMGRLVLSTWAAFKAKYGKRRTRRLTIATAKLSIVAGKTTTVKIILNAAGRRLLSEHHGRLAAHITILQPTTA